jgi:hypothetical protein
MQELVPATERWRTPTIRTVIVPIWFHWTAVLLRATYVKGAPRYRRVNVSLHGLLEDFVENVDVFIAAVRSERLRAWLGRRPTRALVLTRLRKDIRELERVGRPVKRYADTVAHAQVRERRLKGRRLRLAREFAREIIGTYHGVLTTARLPTTARDRVSAAFEREVEQIGRRPPN